MSSYKENTADYQAIVKHFAGCDFKPKLESYVDVDEYVRKILANAERFEHWEDKELAGLVAIYCNDYETRQAFITMVSVMSKYGGRGIASDLLQRAIEHCRKLNFKEIRLEVRADNAKATRLYEKFGFVIIEKTPTILKMALSI